MNKILLSAVTGFTACIFSLSTLAGNGAPSGPHYNLNIIGVSNPKKADMTGSNRHTIFVPLYSRKNSDTGLVDSKIWLTPGEDFKVCDGNGFDAAYGCPGEEFDDDWGVMVSKKQGAVFQLPCNTNITGYWDTDGDGKIESNGDDDMVELISCNETVDTATGQIIPVEETDIVPTAHYQVWARALGKPDGSATVTTCATVQGELECSMENTVQNRTTGKSSFTDVTHELTSLVVVYCWMYDAETGDCTDERTTRVALFAGDTEDWFWNYDNKGLRLAQLRFYEVPQ